MIDQLNIYGLDKVQVAIERIKLIKPRGGSFYLAFSGGKDSVVIKALADLAGVPYDAHYNITSVDPPELVKFIKTEYPDVALDIPRDNNGRAQTMWRVIAEHTMPPTQKIRYCCKFLKEGEGEGRDKITGVRWAESNRRRANRSGLEVETGTKNRELLDPDNADEEMARYCMQSKGFILNPIIDWTDEDVWEFIRRYNVPYCKLYDQGFKRLGCIGCPMAPKARRVEGFERWPKYKAAYIRAFDRMLENNKQKGLKTHNWENGEAAFNWWINREF